jgi:hypothetical protein
MWTATTGKQHIPKTNQYQTDLTDEEWHVIEPHLLAGRSEKREYSRQFGSYPGNPG